MGDLSSAKVSPQSHRAQQAGLQDILITEELLSRPCKPRDAHGETNTLLYLARLMTSAPHELVNALLRSALKLCHAGTAGLSLLETTPSGEQIFRWTHLAGALDQYIGGSTPRHRSPCGVTLDRNAPQLFRHPYLFFEYFQGLANPIEEALVLPIKSVGSTEGTIWIVSHNEETKFDSEDARIMANLAEFCSSGLRLVQSLDAERQTRERTEKEAAEQREVEKTLRRTQSRLEFLVESRTSQLRELSARLIVMQDEERRRIARELHDSTGQYLSALQMNLSALQRTTPNLADAQKAQISDSMDITERCLTEIRTMSYLLHPPLLDEMGLKSALEWYVDGFAKRSGIQVELNIAEDLGRLSTETETALFRIVQQSLMNIHRHSGSHVAKIIVAFAGEGLVVEICDEGRGIPAGILDGINTGRQLPGVGIAGMRERISNMGGLLELRSSGNGTTVAVSLPVRKAGRAAAP